MRNFDVKLRYAYVRLKRKVSLYFTLWFLALLAGVSLIIDSIFISGEAYTLKLWSTALVMILAIKLAYDATSNVKRQYTEFKEENKQTDRSLRQLDRSLGSPNTNSPKTE